tara:strand:- start:1227 stop:1718 length:492 start_codon:yes stop_codon:yes gene_type:complete
MWSGFERAKIQGVIMKNADASWSDFLSVHFGNADLTNADFSCSLTQNIHYEKAKKHGLNIAWCVSNIAEMTKEDIIASYAELKKWKGKIPASLWSIIKTIIDRYESEIKMLRKMNDITGTHVSDDLRKDLMQGIKEYVASDKNNPYKIGKKEYASDKRGNYEK